MERKTPTHTGDFAFASIAFMNLQLTKLTAGVPQQQGGLSKAASRKQAVEIAWRDWRNANSKFPTQSKNTNTYH